MNQKDREILGHQRIKMDKLQKQIDEIKTVVDKIYNLLNYQEYHPNREKRPTPYEYPRFSSAKATIPNNILIRGENEVVLLKEAERYNPWGDFVPYIKEESRAILDYAIMELAARVNQGDGFAGKLNYAISKLFNYTLKDKGLNYANINEMVGALECIKLELYRRVASPYEDEKIELNGDVYDES